MDEWGLAMGQKGSSDIWLSRWTTFGILEKHVPSFCIATTKGHAQETSNAVELKNANAKEDVKTMTIPKIDKLSSIK